MNRQTLQCIGKSTDGRSETKDSLVTPSQLNAVCSGEPMPNEPLHSESRPKVKQAFKAAEKDQTASKATSTRCPKAKLNGPGGHALSQVQPHKDQRERGGGPVKQQLSSDAQSPVSIGSSAHALRPSEATERCKAPAAAREAVTASCTTPGVCVPSHGTSGCQPEHQPDQSPSEEEEERCDDEDDEGPVRSAPLELLAEFLKAVMEKDYQLSQKLCHMILIYEPENPEAKLFMPLIEERLLIAQEEEERQKREDTGCCSEEEEDEDDGDEDDDDGDDSDSEDEDDEDSDEDGEEPTDNSESSSSSGEDDDDDDEEELERRECEEQERCKRAVLIL